MSSRTKHEETESLRRRILRSVVQWFDAERLEETEEGESRIEMVRLIPFTAMHLACLSVIWVGVSGVAVWSAVALYFLRMFAITGFYHRYFSHRSFKTGRVFQFLMAFGGATSAQRGPLWWAAHHRIHHRHSDRPEDRHSPRQHGFLWSHMGWFMTRSSFRTRVEVIKDFHRFPELRFLDRYDMLAPVLLGLGLYVFGESMAQWAPQYGTTGSQMLVWGLISTIVLYHATYTINSLAHSLGRRRYPTKDSSRNNLALALITLGEGWHNNHHHFPAAARQGFFWWEIDITYYILKVLSFFGVIWELRPVPAQVLHAHRSGGEGP